MTSYYISGPLSVPPSKSCGVLAPLLSPVLSLIHAGFPPLWPQIQSWTPTPAPGRRVLCLEIAPTWQLQSAQAHGGFPIPAARATNLLSQEHLAAPCPDTPRSSHPAPSVHSSSPGFLAKVPPSTQSLGTAIWELSQSPPHTALPLGPSSRPATASICHVTTDRVLSHSWPTAAPSPLMSITVAFLGCRPLGFVQASLLTCKSHPWLEIPQMLPPPALSPQSTLGLCTGSSPTSHALLSACQIPSASSRLCSHTCRPGSPAQCPWAGLGALPSILPTAGSLFGPSLSHLCTMHPPISFKRLVLFLSTFIFRRSPPSLP